MGGGGFPFVTNFDPTITWRPFASQPSNKAVSQPIQWIE
jgi:hypothetical protein